MLYFRDYKDLAYRFGNEEYTVSFQDLTTYVDILDQVKENNSFYSYVHIPEGYRPDQMSNKLYGTPLYYWTFYLLNDKLRESGWPQTREQLLNKAKHDYPNQVVNIRQSFDLVIGGEVNPMFLPGRTVTSGTASGVVVKRNLDLGQIFIRKTSEEDFVAGDQIIAQVGTRTQDDVATIFSVDTQEYNSAHHYVEEANGPWVDINPLSATGAANLTEVSILEYIEEQNDDLRRIRVLTRDSIIKVVSAYKQAVRTVI